MNLIERQHALRQLRMIGRLLGSLLVATLLPVLAVADSPIASSSFVGAEDPLSENGAWAALTSFAPQGTRFQKNNGAYADQLFAKNHAGARTTAVVPADHFSEIVVGHLGSDINNPQGGTPDCCNNVGPIVRVQASGPAIDSHYLWWAGLNINQCCNNALYRIDANGTTYNPAQIFKTSPVVDGDRLRLIARGLVLYGIKNGVRDFIYNTGPDSTKYSTGTTGMLAHPSTAVTDAKIASWSSGAAPVSLATWTSSTFAGTEDPLDEGDRWYPLPGYSGFKKSGGFASARPPLHIGDTLHNASGVWSITPPATQYSEVTLGSVASGGGGPIVRIDRNNPGQTGWLLFLWADNPSLSGIYKMTPDGGFTLLGLPFTATIVSGDKWRLTATGNTLDVFRNGVFQFTRTTDGSYATGDVGIEAFTQNFSFMGWEGGDPAGPPPTPDTTPPTPPSNLTATAASSSQINLAWTASTDDVGVTGYLVERCQGSGCTGFAQVATVAGTTYNDTGLAAATSYSYRVRATDAAGNLSPYSTTASATTPAPIPSPPTITSFTPTSGPVGSSVSISGTNFTGATTVKFNGVSAGFTVSSDTAIQATVPPGATSGPIGVTTSGGTATSSSAFTVTQQSFTLSVNKTGSGSGTVTSSDGRINCGPTCSATYNSGTTVTLTATPASGSIFTGWSGCDAVSGTTCSVTMSAARAVTATFTLQSFTLSVSKTGLIGSGTVTSSDGGINCGTTCSASYNSGTVVTLTATPTGLLSIFTGWTGCDTASGTTCTVIMTRARTVTADFLP